MLFSKNKMKSSQDNKIENIDLKNLPKHIAIIMDGNGRWAEKRGLPRVAGHRAGVETLRKAIKFSSDIGIKVLTLYAFSTENWKRPRNEVDALMNLLVEYLNKEIKELHSNNVKIMAIGNIKELPEKPRIAVLDAMKLTQDNDGLVVNVALNYGGRDELLNAFNKLLLDIKSGKINDEIIKEKTLEQYLYTSQLPDPDLLIRPSGELRISNFMLWQLAYTEFWFTDVLWPDFKEDHMIEAILSYQNRDRRFGGVTNGGKGV